MSEVRAYEPTVTRVKTVRVIPPTIQPLSDIPAFSAHPRRVAAYARVSTISEEQLTSYEAQVKHYTEYIKSKEASDNWQFVDVYTDKGITGVSTKKREGFNRMIQDALAGKIEISFLILIQTHYSETWLNPLKSGTLRQLLDFSYC